jgi:hypothetical protein
MDTNLENERGAPPPVGSPQHAPPAIHRLQQRKVLGGKLPPPTVVAAHRWC